MFEKPHTRNNKKYKEITLFTYTQTQVIHHGLTDNITDLFLYLFYHEFNQSPPVRRLTRTALPIVPESISQWHQRHHVPLRTLPTPHRTEVGAKFARVRAPPAIALKILTFPEVSPPFVRALGKRTLDQFPVSFCCRQVDSPSARSRS